MYALFGGEEKYENGGIYDLQEIFDTKEEAVFAAKNKEYSINGHEQKLEWWTIVGTKTWKVVDDYRLHMNFPAFQKYIDRASDIVDAYGKVF